MTCEDSDPGTIDAAVEQIRSFIKDGHIADALWKNWLPQLLRNKRYDAAVEFSMAGATTKPGLTPVYMAFRAKALLALDNPAEALAAAKSYYNVCDIKSTADAVDIVAAAFPKAYPQDPGIAGRFKDEQANASAASRRRRGR